MTTLNVHDIQPQLTANRRFWCGWSGADHDSDFPLIRTGIRQPLFNGVLRLRNSPVEQAIEEARRALTGTQRSWWVGADSDEGTAEALLEHGATLFNDMPVMAIDVTTVDDVERPSGLEIKVVTERPDMREYVHTYAGPLGFDLDDVDLVTDGEMNFAYPDVIHLGGYLDGKIVGTCTLSLGTEVGALYCIATDPDYRRRGVATALTREALRLTRGSGRRIVTLQSEDAGVPVYSKIGFQEVARYRLYAF